MVDGVQTDRLLILTQLCFKHHQLERAQRSFIQSAHHSEISCTLVPLHQLQAALHTRRVPSNHCSHSCCSKQSIASAVASKASLSSRAERSPGVIVFASSFLQDLSNNIRIATDLHNTHGITLATIDTETDSATTASASLLALDRAEHTDAAHNQRQPQPEDPHLSY